MADEGQILTSARPSTIPASGPRPGRSGGVRGGAHLLLACDAHETTFVQRQRVSPPLHLSKPLRYGCALALALNSPTAGLFSGDELDLRIECDPGTTACVTSSAAQRAYTMTEGTARVRQELRVAPGGLLDYFAPPLILQAGASLRQDTLLQVHPDADLLYTEILYPGRLARGEAFHFKSFRSSLRGWRGGSLCLLERGCFSPAVPKSLAGWQGVFPTGCLATILWLTAREAGPSIGFLQEADLGETRLGASPLPHGGLGVKILAPDPLSIRAAVRLVRAHLYERLERPPPPLHRLQAFAY